MIFRISQALEINGSTVLSGAGRREDTKALENQLNAMQKLNQQENASCSQRVNRLEVDKPGTSTKGGVLITPRSGKYPYYQHCILFSMNICVFRQSVPEQRQNDYGFRLRSALYWQLATPKRHRQSRRQEAFSRG